MLVNKFSNLYALNTINNEGIGYAVTSYCSGESFKDPKTVELWNKAKDSLRDLEKYLESYVREHPEEDE